jgi:hypothetical protein
VFAKFYPKNVTNLYHPPTHQIYLSQIIFCSPKLKMKLKELHFVNAPEIQEDVTDELRKVKKEEFSAAFQKLYDRAKAYIYARGAYFE